MTDPTAAQPGDEARAREVLAAQYELDGRPESADRVRHAWPYALKDDEKSAIAAMLAFANERPRSPEYGEAEDAIMTALLTYDPTLYGPESWGTTLANIRPLIRAALRPQETVVREGVAIPAGMKPWAGGREPDDWDENGFLALRGGGVVPVAGVTPYWFHEGNPNDIVAYTPLNASPVVGGGR